MLRCGLGTVINQTRHQQQRKLSLSFTANTKNGFSMNRQGKIMSKLFGQRVKGSKKRWYPTAEETSHNNTGGGGLFFKATQLNKPGGAGKNTTRRSAVLNKLFMEQISSLLAAGGTAESFLGRGLQLTRVKIAPDFSCVNVYWLGQGDPLGDGKLAEDLNHCSGLLRHELSQLRVMGEVPRVHFVQDKTFANIEHVENLLKNLNTGTEDSEETKIDFQNQTENRVKEEFYGNSKTIPADPTLETDETLPPMRHDVFGLDHRNITLKILTKMRKTKQAWEAHSEKSQTCDEHGQIKNLSLLESVQQKIIDANEASKTDFDKFLAQRRERKNTPERKKFRQSEEIIFLNDNEDHETDAVVSKELKAYLNQEDFLYEEKFDERKS